MNLRLTLITLLMGMVTFWGCPLIEGQLGGSLLPMEIERDQANLSAAHEAFMDGNYKKARALFAASQHAQNANLARQALYGMACTQLVSAQTPQDFDQGLKLWTRWTELRDPALGGEDPRLLTQALPRMAPKPPPPAEAPPEEKTPPKNQAHKLIQAQRHQNEVLTAKIALLEKEIRILSYFEEYSRNLESEIQTLRHQIQTMQAIDQNIQQKKQEISSQETTP